MSGSKCTGCADFRCVVDAGLTIFDFGPRSADEWTQWLHVHQSTTNNPTPCCDSPNLYLCGDGAHKGKLRCRRCRSVSRRGVIPFFEKSHLPPWKLVALLFCMVEGVPQGFIRKQIGMGKKAITQWQVWFTELAPPINNMMLQIAKPLAKKLSPARHRRSLVHHPSSFLC